ncbi:MAG: DUF362 domain-containing protein [bacterium]|nr:DUF362 domain-containing protein [bacterium]
MALYHHRLDNYDPAPLAAALEAGAEALGGMSQLLGGRRNLLLKPNLLALGKGPPHHLTHPAFILAVVDWLQVAGCQVSLADSPAFGDAALIVHYLGLTEALARREVRVFTFKNLRYFQTDNPKFRRLSIAAELGDFDGLINLPKLKTHCQCHFSGAVKNLFGCVVGKRKPARHFASRGDEAAFALMLQDNAHQAGAFLHIADGITSMHVDGPRGGEPFELGSLLMSENPQQIDWAFCRLVGLDPMDTQQFKVAGLQPEVLPLGAPLVQQLGWQQAEKVDVFFNPLQLVRSVAKQLLTRIQ